MQWIATDMHRDGVAMRVATIQSALASDQVLARFNKLWQAHFGTTRTLGNKTAMYLSSQQRIGNRHFLLTLELAPQANTQGLVSQVALNPSPTHPANQLKVELPPGAITLSDIQSHDYGQLNRTRVIQHPQGIEVIYKFFIRTLIRASWQSISNQSETLKFVLPEQKQQLIITQHPGNSTSLVLIHTQFR